MKPTTVPALSGLLSMLLLLSGPATAGDSPFEAGVHGRSRLEFIGPVPVMHLYGTPREMGEAAGVLTRKVLARMGPLFASEYLRLFTGLVKNKDKDTAMIRKQVLEAAKAIPAHRREELTAMAKAGGIKMEELLLANLLPEVAPRVNCSTVFVGAGRMADKQPILGRNLDFPDIANLVRYGLVVVYHEKGRLPLASFTFPGLVGVLTGINSKGLCGATMDEFRFSNKVRPKAIPRFMLYRELLGRHTTLAEVEKAAQAQKTMSGGNFTVVDSKGNAAVLEGSGGRWCLRRPANHMVYATNHFRAPGYTRRPRTGNRYRTFVKYDGDIPTFTPRDVLLLVKRTACEFINVQAMVIRPVSGKVDFAFGRVPAVRQKFHTLTRKQLFPRPPAKPVAPARRQVEHGSKGK